MSPLFDVAEKPALAYADRMTVTGQDIDDAFFGRPRSVFGNEALLELTATIAWEIAPSTFNRAPRVESQGRWRGPGASATAGRGSP